MDDLGRLLRRLFGRFVGKSDETGEAAPSTESHFASSSGGTETVPPSKILTEHPSG
jgi:hypothetical protein